MNLRRQNGRRSLAGILALILMLFTVACGSGDRVKTGDGKAEGTDSYELLDEDWVYVSQDLTLEAEQEAFYTIKQVGDHLYYPVAGWDEENGDSTFRIGRYSVSDGSTEELPAALGGSVSCFDIGEDGSVYAVVIDWSADGGAGGNVLLLEKYDASGEKIYSVDIKGYTDALSPESGEYLVDMISDSRGGVCLVSNTKVFLFDGQGNFIGKVEPFSGNSDNRISLAGMGTDEKLYVCIMDKNFKCSLAGIDLEKKTADVIAKDFPGGSGKRLNRGVEKDFLVHDGTTVYDYDPEAKTKKPLFSWVDCGINGSNVSSLGATSDGKILVVLNDWAAHEGSVQLLSRISPDQKPEKEEIVLGSLYAVTVLQDAVAKFNKSSDKYHITIKKYMEGEWSEEAMEDALTRFKLEIASGNGPDIIELSFLDTESLVKQGFLEDLTPWLEKSAVVNREDFVENVLDANVYDGMLAGLPKQFTIYTVIGRASDVGTDMGWTLEDFMEMGEGHPGVQILEYAGKGSLLSFCMGRGMGTYVDRETGRCSFDSPEFIRLLEFADRYGDAVETDTDAPVQERAQRGEILLMEGEIAELDRFQLYNEIFEGEACMVGYPTADGSPVSNLLMGEVCCIAKKSSHKEGAWAFLESFVTAENTDHMYALPALKSRLEEQIQDLLDVSYVKDMDGNIVTDENGDPIPMGRNTRTVTYGGAGGWSYTYRPVTEEEIERILEVIRVARPLPADYGSIREIVNEEAEEFFRGSKSAEEVAGVIQRRAQLYLDENK